MADVESQIDELYQLPPGEFTAARTALAKTVVGNAARQVRALKKPASVPWAVNQVYWKAHAAYNSVMKAGHTLRTVQIAMLKGKKADVRTAAEEHRQAIALAVREAMRFAADAGLNPSAEQVARMFEALSVAPTPPATAGRFTDVIAPSGFDALAGITPARRVHVPEEREAGEREAVEPGMAPSKADRAAEKRRAQQELRARREAEAQLKAATRDLDRARERAQAARNALARAEADVSEAERQVAAARDRLKG